MNILFIDDEPRRMKPVVEEFEACGHTVHPYSNVDEPLAVIRRSNETFDLVVMDISMPSGVAFRHEDTDGGTRTGLALYEAIREARPKQRIVIYTNVSDPRAAERFAREDRRYCRFVRKPEVFPFEFVKEMEDFVAERQASD